MSGGQISVRQTAEHHCRGQKFKKNFQLRQNGDRCADRRKRKDGRWKKRIGEEMRRQKLTMKALSRKAAGWHNAEIPFTERRYAND